VHRQKLKSGSIKIYLVDGRRYILTPEESEIFSHIDGKNSVKNIVQKTGKKEATLNLIEKLNKIGAISFKKTLWGKG